MTKITLHDIQQKKTHGHKITALTAYDYSLAKLVDEAGIDIVLVGDSLANVVLGLDKTADVGMAEMLHHTKAVRRGVRSALLVGDMPYESYQVDPGMALQNAKRFMDEARCDAVKVEWFGRCLDVADSLVQSGIPVMGHIGLTPQTAEQLGGMKVQGKDAQSALDIIGHAKALEERGCFSLVLECIPDRIARIITEQLTIPTIGIGAGAYCDGQVLVINDLLGLFDRYHPKFVKRFVNLSPQITAGIKEYKEAVEGGFFPAPEHSFQMDEKEFEKLKIRY